MAQCECLQTCPFFNDRMAEMPATAQLMKTRFCESDQTNRARHMVFVKLGTEAVPIDLYPTQVKRAQEQLS